MIANRPATGARTSCQGVAQIVRFNWPMYVGALTATGVGASLLSAVDLSGLVAVLVGLLTAVVAWWAIASLAASHWVYDRAGLFGLEWLHGLGPAAGRWASIHVGLDEFSPHLRRRFGEPVAIVDVFDPAIMTEHSIARAQAATAVDPRTLAASHERLPLEDDALEAVFMLFAAHELRGHSQRVALLREARRVLAANGRVVVVEHLRDAANVLAFGPGAFHFFSLAVWRRAFAEAGLVVERERCITPLVRAFVLRSNP